VKTVTNHFILKRRRLCDPYVSLFLPDMEERRILRRTRIRFGPLITGLATMFEAGAVLGAAIPRSTEGLVKLCVDWDEDEAWQMWLGRADSHHSELDQSNGGNAYVDLVMHLIYPEVESHARGKFLLANAKEQVERARVFGDMRAAFTWGIPLGAAYPEATRQRYEATSRQASALPTDIAAMLKVSVDRPGYELWQSQILDIAYGFAEIYYPNEIASLGLPPPRSE
jgi:hypothetical protein